MKGTVRQAAVLAVAVAAVGVGVLALAGAPANKDEPAQPGPPGPARVEVKAGQYRITGPFTHKNLAVFLIHGEDKLKDAKFLTLQEALHDKLAVVHETGQVNELVIDNLSKTHYLYIQSGDIVKGGRQDRVLSLDLIVPPETKGLRLKSFCVERGRWTGRGAERADQFSTSVNAVSSRDLKMALKHSQSQGEVWGNVAKLQGQLSGNLQASVQSGESATSLELTLSDADVEKAVQGYVDALRGIVERRPHIVGFAFAINGELNSADVYACKALFMKLWPKLLKAAAVEAVAEFRKDKTFQPPKPDEVRKFLEEAQKGAASVRDLTKDARLRILESDGAVNWNLEVRVYDVRNLEAAMPSVVLHESYLRKAPGDSAPPAPEEAPVQQQAPPGQGRRE